MAQRPNEAQAIKNLQRYLRQLSYDEVSIKPPPVDGIFESDTRDALMQFQALKELPQTGVADAITWELLYAAYRASLASNSPPRTVALFPRSPVGYILSRDMSGILITALQYMLGELALNYEELNGVTVNGEFDKQTERAVLAFQRHHALRPTGTVDKDTWNAIADRYNSIFLRYPVE